MHQHVYKENNVLFPRALKREEEAPTNDTKLHEVYL